MDDMQKLMETYPENFTGETLAPAPRAPTGREMKADSLAATAELKIHAEALVKYLWDYLSPYYEIRITWDGFQIYEEHPGVIVPYSGEK